MVDVVYLALPGQVVFVVSAAVQRDQEVGAGVSVSDGKTGVGHFLARGSCRDGRVSIIGLFWLVCVGVCRGRWDVKGAPKGRTLRAWMEGDLAGESRTGRRTGLEANGMLQSFDDGHFVVELRKQFECSTRRSVTGNDLGRRRMEGLATETKIR